MVIKLRQKNGEIGNVIEWHKLFSNPVYYGVVVKDFLTELQPKNFEVSSRLLHELSSPSVSFYFKEERRVAALLVRK